MQVHFVSFHAKPMAFLDDASFRYRCENLAFALNKQGVSAKLQHITSFALESGISHVVFHRPKYSTRFQRLIKQLKLANITAIADFDDLVFDEEYVGFSPAVLNNILPTKKVVKKYREHFEALSFFENISVSTQTLSRHVRRLFPHANVSILNNATHHGWPYKKPLSSVHRRPIITYFPGTRSHDRDFWQIEEVLEFFLHNNPSVNLLVIGPLLSPLLAKGSNQIRHVRRLPFINYTQAVSNAWVNLLPLEPTPFNQCKSALKVIEAAAYHAPTICSPLPDASRFEGVGAITAIEQQQWLSSLDKLMEPAFYKSTVSHIEKQFSLVADPILMADKFCKLHQLAAD